MIAGAIEIAESGSPLAAAMGEDFWILAPAVLLRFGESAQAAFHHLVSMASAVWVSWP